MRTRTLCISLCSSLTLIALACSDGSSGSSNVTRVDSAGIEIVATSTQLWSEGEGWRIAPEPLVSIGQIEGESAYLFGDVTGAIRIGERIAVADAQGLEIRYFDLNGVHVVSAGGPGEGPGEFGSLLLFERCEGNRAFAYDIFDQTVQVRDASGELVREQRTVEPGSANPRRPYKMVCSTEGSGFVAVGWGDMPSPMSVDAAGTVVRQMAPAWVLGADVQPTAELGEHLSSERFMTVNRETGQLSGSGPHPFGRATTFALGLDEVFVGSGEALSVDVFTREGRIARKLRGPAEDLSLSESLIADYRAAELDEVGARRRTVLEDQDFPMPSGLPAYTEMKLDPDGALWLRRFALPWQSASRWGVFAPDGGFLGHITLPEGMTLTDVGRDWVLGVITDELGVERVRLHTLTKN